MLCENMGAQQQHDGNKQQQIKTCRPPAMGIEKGFQEKPFQGKGRLLYWLLTHKCLRGVGCVRKDRCRPGIPPREAVRRHRWHREDLQGRRCWQQGRNGSTVFPFLWNHIPDRPAVLYRSESVLPRKRHIVCRHKEKEAWHRLLLLKKSVQNHQNNSNTLFWITYG